MEQVATVNMYFDIILVDVMKSTCDNRIFIIDLDCDMFVTPKQWIHKWQSLSEQIAVG
jgi:hypothetical protein